MQKGKKKNQVLLLADFSHSLSALVQPYLIFLDTLQLKIVSELIGHETDLFKSIYLMI